MSEPAFPNITRTDLAVIELLRRTGAKSIDFRWSESVDDDDDGPMVWMALATYPGRAGAQIADPPGPRYRYEVDAALLPGEALLRLAERLIDGGECTHCHRPTVFDPDAVNAGRGMLDAMGCVYRFDPELAVYRRSCEGNPAGNRAARRGGKR